MQAFSNPEVLNRLTGKGTPLNPEQQRAHDAAVSAMNAGQNFVLSGLAGSGKTTTLVEIIRTLKSYGRRPAVCAPTGKAASVINSKQSLVRANTLHSTLSARPYDLLEPVYKRLDEIEAKRVGGEELSIEEQDEEAKLLKRVDSAQYTSNLKFEPCDIGEFLDEYNALVFDESSMIGKEIYRELIERIPVPKLFVGDKAQLPPVGEECAVNLARADAELKTIVRQQEGSGILRFAHGVHAGRVMGAREAEKYGDLTYVPDHIPQLFDDYLADHQVVCWKNDERWAIAARSRAVRGVKFDARMHGLPTPGEQLMVDANRKKERLMRGDILTVVNVKHYGDSKTLGNKFLAQIECQDSQGRDRLLLVSLTDMIPAAKTLDYHSEEARRRRQANIVGVPVQFACAITCHKAQGSEWDKVLYVGSMMPEGHKDWRSHWYTGCTRAKNKLVIASYHFTHESRNNRIAAAS